MIGSWLTVDHSRSPNNAHKYHLMGQISPNYVGRRSVGRRSVGALPPASREDQARYRMITEWTRSGAECHPEPVHVRKEGSNDPTSCALRNQPQAGTVRLACPYESMNRTDGRPCEPCTRFLGKVRGMSGVFSCHCIIFVARQACNSSWRRFACGMEGVRPRYGIHTLYPITDHDDRGVLVLCLLFDMEHNHPTIVRFSTSIRQ